MDDDLNDPETTLTRARAPRWELQEILGWCLLAALLLMVVAYVAAGIIEAGATPQEHLVEVTAYYASDWASPYFTVFPLAALAIAWWQLRRWGPSVAGGGAEGETAEGGDGEAEAGYTHLLRARTSVTAVSVALAVIVCAAIGVVVTSLMLFPESEASGSQVWPSEAETLASAAAALLLCGIGLVIAFSLRGEASRRLASDTEEVAEPEPEPDPVPVAD
ncbi:MAG: hypothetical protein ACLQT7_08280 [Candidatus Dormibacteria bacterium]